MKRLESSNFFILTGGPGSGKTMVLNELETRGYSVVPEVARSIIQEQSTIGGDATHTRNRKAFCDLMLERSIIDYHKMETYKKPAFFDRGIPDLWGYSKAFCGGMTDAVTKAVAYFRYNKMVFIFPPWSEIYKNDIERQQDFQEALKTYEALKDAYYQCGYVLVEVPKSSVVERSDFILQSLAYNCLDDLKNDINALLGFHEDTPRINYGPCGIFAKLFFDAWNERFEKKAHIVFIMTSNRDECWHIAVRLPTGELYDGGIGVHFEDVYRDKYVIDEMLQYDHDLLEKWSYGLERNYPRFCPNFDRSAVALLINQHVKNMSEFIK